MKRTLIYDILIFVLVIALLLLIKVPYLKVFLPCILVLLYSYKTQGFKSSLGFSKPKNALKLIATALGLAICISLLGYFVLFPSIEKFTEAPLKFGVFAQVKNNTTVFFTSLIIGWIVGGFMEEIIFRGFMISIFTKYFNPKIGTVLGIILPFILFGYLHGYQGISGQILIGITGSLFAIIYIFSKRNLWLNILTHGFINTISMFILYFDLIG